MFDCCAWTINNFTTDAKETFKLQICGRIEIVSISINAVVTALVNIFGRRGDFFPRN